MGWFRRVLFGAAIVATTAVTGWVPAAEAASGLNAVEQFQFLRVAPASGSPGTMFVVVGKCPAFNPDFPDRPLSSISVYFEDGPLITETHIPFTRDGRYLTTMRVPTDAAPNPRADVDVACFYQRSPKTGSETFQFFNVTAD